MQKVNKPHWIEITDDPSTLPKDGQVVVYFFEPFGEAWIGKFYRGNTNSSDHRYDGQFHSAGGFCDAYDATHWHSVGGYTEQSVLKDKIAELLHEIEELKKTIKDKDNASI